MSEATTETFDLYIDENDGMIYRHFPPEHPTSSPVFDPDGVDIEQSETELIGVFDAMKSEITRLREAFEHTHVACKPGQVDPPGYPDNCQECGFDIRDPIHKRISRQALEPKP